MAGQENRKFDVTPNGMPAVGTSAEAPKASTDLYRPTAALQSADASHGLAQAGAALSQFFGTATTAMLQADQTLQRETITQTQRENEALKQQAVVDQKSGKGIDQAVANRQDYYGTYQAAAADDHAFELTEQYRAAWAKQPKDGSVNAEAFAKQFWKDQVGSGTGDRDYDSRLMFSFNKSVQTEVAQGDDQVRRTVDQNTTQTIIQDATRQVFQSGGMTPGALGDLRNRIGTVAHGDQKVADSILFAAMSGVQNDGQANSVLSSMQALGMDKDYPEQFNRVSGLMLERTNKVKTKDAGESVQLYQLELAQERSHYPHGQLPPDRVIAYARRWNAIDSIHGVGMHGSELEAMWKHGVAKEAAINTWKRAFSGVDGTQVLSRVASAIGAQTGKDETSAQAMNKYYDSSVSEELVKVSPALRASVDGTNIVNPMASDEAARDYASFIMAGGPNKGHRAASNDTISDTFKTMMGTSLNGRDPKLMERSFNFYNQLAQGGMTKDELHRYFPDSTAENHFWGMQAMSQGGRAITQVAKDLTDYPFDQKAIDAAAETGHVDLAKLSGLSGKPADIDAKIAKARNEAFLDTAGRKRFWGSDDVGQDSNQSAVFDALLADQFMLMKRGGKKVDIDLAIKNVAGQTGSMLVVPTMQGGLQAIKDPFEGRGRTMTDPLNSKGSDDLSIQKGFRPLYALGAKVKNAAGDLEDTLETWAEDRAGAIKNFPGKVKGDVYLERPGTNGLSMVKDGSGQMVQFFPGEPVNMPPNPDKVTLPTDAKEAEAFLKKSLPPGWYALPVGFNGASGTGLVLHYGARLKYGEEERDAKFVKRGGDVQQFRKDTAGATATVDTQGGAAIRFPNATGSATAASKANSDTKNNGASWGDLGSNVVNAAGAAADKYGDIAQQQRDAAKTGWRLVGGSKRLDKVSDAFSNKDGN